MFPSGSLLSAAECELKVIRPYFGTLLVDLLAFPRLHGGHRLNGRGLGVGRKASDFFLASVVVHITASADTSCGRNVRVTRSPHGGVSFGTGVGSGKSDRGKGRQAGRRGSPGADPHSRGGSSITTVTIFRGRRQGDVAL